MRPLLGPERHCPCCLGPPEVCKRIVEKARSPEELRRSVTLKSLLPGSPGTRFRSQDSVKGPTGDDGLTGLPGGSGAGTVRAGFRAITCSPKSVDEKPLLMEKVLRLTRLGLGFLVPSPGASVQQFAGKVPPRLLRRAEAEGAAAVVEEEKSNSVKAFWKFLRPGRDMGIHEMTMLWLSLGDSILHLGCAISPIAVMTSGVNPTNAFTAEASHHPGDHPRLECYGQPRRARKWAGARLVSAAHSSTGRFGSALRQWLHCRHQPDLRCQHRRHQQALPACGCQGALDPTGLGADHPHGRLWPPHRLSLCFWPLPRHHLQRTAGCPRDQ
ncbi:HPT2 [Symbiodinium microadriaticum]|nr:HPT2 [Symbiodinium microadriaticum]